MDAKQTPSSHRVDSLVDDLVMTLVFDKRAKATLIQNPEAYRAAVKLRDLLDEAREDRALDALTVAAMRDIDPEAVNERMDG